MTGELLGREAEQHEVRAVLGAARNGRGGALLIQGEPGIGKTALLEAATSGLAGMRSLQVAGHQPEADMPYAAVQRLAMSLRSHVETLPSRQQQALRVA